ncbi:NAD-dependent glycerol-3-phosphate dehydrogenase [Nitzschia inconspicua]|uniref:NAD-dependent glycerol-3-phosphate dehydrogenase n=1 Tax=Nitzschia inconspicua TaxID=303405 RepID=A0A9K3L3V1_9STRA|nr:NAD-dependent glycerol-3-phosphate dehydrogenase [Nitzschia inconspicua]
MKRLLIVFWIVFAQAHARVDRDATTTSPERPDEDDANANITKSISLIGLGGMGKAIAKCFMSHGYHVHVWNRTPPKNRDWVEQPERFRWHESPTSAIMASNVTLLVINSAPRLETVQTILFDPATDISSILQGKTVVNMVNHDPYAGQDLDDMLKNAQSHHVAALLFGVPETVCSPASHILIGSPSRTIEAKNDGGSFLLQDGILPALQYLGQVHDFSRGGVGLASVVYLCLVQSLYFGLAGYELSLLILQKYLSSIDVATDTVAEISSLYQELATTLLKNFLPAFLPIISKTIVQQQWTQSYVPAMAVIDMFELHDIVFKRLNLLPDGYHTIYTKYLRTTVQAAIADDQDPEAVGVSAVVQHYSMNDNRIQNKMTGDSQVNVEL